MCKSLLERFSCDLSSLEFSELTALCAEIRRVIITTVAKNGGHLSSNLGVVELSVALHSVFDSPKDKIVWDVGHQCYAHKLLTGRYRDFDSLRKLGGVAGFPRRSESVHDAFDTGHASTSISAALGLLAAERLNGGDGCSVAVIGDGALTGGLAYEALSNIGSLPLIVLLNDNKMSINANVGSLSRHLSRLSMKRKYQVFRRNFDSTVKKIPLAGESLNNFVQRLKRAVKAVFYHDNFFVDLGFEYVGPIDGHNLAELIEVLKDVRKLGRPVVVHILTKKGKGYEPAEADPGAFHGVPPFLLEKGVLPAAAATWTSAFSTAILEAGRANPKVVALTAAMEHGTGLSAFKNEFPSRFFDAGIAEAHAVTFAAALAVGGFRPVAAIYSTFVQRAVDSIIHDTGIGSLPVVFALDRAGFVGEDGETHQGLFDIPLFRTVPNMAILAPSDADELALMLNWALVANHPCAIRYPKAALPKKNPLFSVPLVTGRGVLIKNEGETCIAFTGGLYREADNAAVLLEAEGIKTDLYNMRFLKPIDEDFLTTLINSYKYFCIIEDGVKCGGAGEYICSVALKNKCNTKIILLNAGDKYYSVGTRDELLRSAGLDGESIAKTIIECSGGR